MKESIDIEWFRSNMAPEFIGYELSYRFFDEGDFGSLNQVEFESKKIGGNIDFWGLGWLGVFVWNYEKEEVSLNLLIEPHREEEKRAAIKKLQDLLK